MSSRGWCVAFSCPVHCQYRGVETKRERPLWGWIMGQSLPLETPAQDPQQHNSGGEFVFGLTHNFTHSYALSLPRTLNLRHSSEHILAIHSKNFLFISWFSADLYFIEGRGEVGGWRLCNQQCCTHFLFLALSPPQGMLNHWDQLE